MPKDQKNGTRSQNTIKVFVRVRPLIQIQLNTQNIVSIAPDEQSVTIYIDQYNQIQTKFDKIISQDKSQKQFFHSVEPFIDQILQAFNLTIFAYGQTGSGKTHTMFGKDWQNNFTDASKDKKLKQQTPLTDIRNDENYAGLIPRCTHHLFECLNQKPGKYNVFCSFLQIYNEKVYDLLQDSPIPHPLVIHESKIDGIFVEGLEQFRVTQYSDCLELMRRGQKNRFIRQTSMNAKSSRSHTIFQILVETITSDQSGIFTRTRLNLCDLAGSEKVNKTQQMGIEHLQELKNINLSLTSLGKVISALSKGLNKNTSIFRESKLTRLLQQSLVGNTNTIIVGAISPSSKNRDQAMNTLKFVERARHIKMTIKPSSISNQSGEAVSRLKEEMLQLRGLLMQKQKSLLPKEVQQKLKILEQENKKLKNETQNKVQDIHNLVQQNRKIKQALVRMQRVAMQQLSNASFRMSQDGASNKDYQSIMNQSKMFDILRPASKLNDSSRYDRSHQSKMDFLPSIHEKRALNRSVDGKPENNRKLSIVADTQVKKHIINNFQLLEKKNKNQQLRLMEQRQTIVNTPKVQSERLSSKDKQTNKNQPTAYSTLQTDSLKIKPRKRLDFAQKIRQLQKKLKGGK